MGDEVAKTKHLALKQEIEDLLQHLQGQLRATPQEEADDYYCDRCGRAIEDFDPYNHLCETCGIQMCSFCLGNADPQVCLDCERYGDDRDEAFEED